MPGQERMRDCNWKGKGEDVMDCQESKGREVKRFKCAGWRWGGYKAGLIIAGYFFLPLELPALLSACLRAMVRFLKTTGLRQSSVSRSRLAPKMNTRRTEVIACFCRHHLVCHPACHHGDL